MFVLRAIVLIKILHILNNLISKVVHAVKALNRPCTRGKNSLHSIAWCLWWILGESAANRQVELCL